MIIQSDHAINYSHVHVSSHQDIALTWLLSVFFLDSTYFHYQEKCKKYGVISKSYNYSKINNVTSLKQAPKQ